MMWWMNRSKEGVFFQSMRSGKIKSLYWWEITCFPKGFIIHRQRRFRTPPHTFQEAVKQMSEGELLQIENPGNWILMKLVYFEIIRSKTASAFSSACGVKFNRWQNNYRLDETLRRKSGSLPDKKMTFDYKEDVGKPTGNDIKEKKKLTLPLIYTLNNIDNSKRGAYLHHQKWK